MVPGVPGVPRVSGVPGSLDSMGFLESLGSLGSLETLLDSVGSLGSLESLGSLDSLRSMRSLESLVSLRSLASREYLGYLGPLKSLNTLGSPEEFLQSPLIMKESSIEKVIQVFPIVPTKWQFVVNMGLLSDEKNFGIYADVYINQFEPVLSMEIAPLKWVPRVVDGSSLHIKRAVAFAPQFQFFDPVNQHGCDLPICIKCSSKMKVSKRWRLDRFCHVIDFFYPKLFLSRGFECSPQQCRCEILATHPIYSSNSIIISSTTSLPR